MIDRGNGQTVGHILTAMRERIFSWKYPPDHPLGEESLSREFKVSRSPVREALRCLEAEGYVYHIKNRGFFIRQFNIKEIVELYAVRLALELHVAEHLALHSGLHEAVLALAQPWRDILESDGIADPEKLARIDESFHISLASLIGNSMLSAHLQQINVRLFAFRSMDFTIVMEQNTLEKSCNSHIAVIDAILLGDSQAAREALRKNLAMGVENIETAMGKILAKTFNF